MTPSEGLGGGVAEEAEKGSPSVIVAGSVLSHLPKLQASRCSHPD